jgi:hypothetical protein
MFKPIDFVIFGIFLLLSVIVGVFHGIKNYHKESFGYHHKEIISIGIGK